MAIDPSLLTQSREHEDAPFRLICLPFAAGGVGAYSTWPATFAPRVDVVPIQLPGRERRLRDTPYSSMAPLVTDLFDTLAPLLDRPWVAFGHSMGAAIVYELARVSTAAGCGPAHLVVSARRAPGSSLPHPPLFALPDNLMVTETERHYGPMPAALRENPSVLAPFLPTMRADYQLLDTWRAPTDCVLSCPLTAISGDADATVGLAALEGWGTLTTGAFRTQLVSGDHFAALRARHEIRDVVARVLDGLTASQVG